MNDVPVTDQTLDMSPMDLFDSIFWGECHLFSSAPDLTIPRSVSDEQFGSVGIRLFTAAFYRILGSRTTVMAL
jgi:hypothetical protein